MTFTKKMQELFDKLGVDPIINRSLSTEEILDCVGCHVCTDEDDRNAGLGEIVDRNGNPTGIWYEEVEY